MVRVLPALVLVCSCSSGESQSVGVGVPDDFRGLCKEAAVECDVDPDPLRLVGAYAGTGETTSTTSSLWSQGAKADFALEVEEQDADGRLSGFINIADSTLEVRDAELRGAGLDFTLYGRVGGGSGSCTSSALGIVQGTASSRELPERITGRLAVRLGEISGSGCSEEERADAGKGATFAYTAQRVDGPLPKWSDCLTPAETDANETCESSCAAAGGTCSARCDSGSPVKRAATCDSKVWAIGGEACGAPIWDGMNAAARCCCE